MLLDMHYITECVPSLTTFSSILLVVVTHRLASRIFLCGREGRGKEKNKTLSLCAMQLCDMFLVLGDTRTF